jgi:hypothetical protein
MQSLHYNSDSYHHLPEQMTFEPIFSKNIIYQYKWPLNQSFPKTSFTSTNNLWTKFL